MRRSCANLPAAGPILGRLDVALDQTSQPDCRRQSWQRFLPANPRGQPGRDSGAVFRQKKKEIFIGGGDLAWLEDEFRAFNSENDYPLHVADCTEENDHSSATICNFQELRRYRWELQRKPVRWLLSSLGMPDNSLDGRFLKKAG